MNDHMAIRTEAIPLKMAVMTWAMAMTNELSACGVSVTVLGLGDGAGTHSGDS
jgi:hypothetical protein